MTPIKIFGRNIITNIPSANQNNANPTTRFIYPHPWPIMLLYFMPKRFTYDCFHWFLMNLDSKYPSLLLP